MLPPVLVLNLKRSRIYFLLYFRSFDEKLDSLKTPELDETKVPSKEEAEKKRSLPLEIYKRQLNRVFTVRTQGGAKYTDNCKSRTVPGKQVSSSCFPTLLFCS